MTAVNMMLSGIGIKHSGISLALADSMIGGCPVPDISIEGQSRWQPSNNLYAVKNIVLNGRTYTQQIFDDLKTILGH